MLRGKCQKDTKKIKYVLWQGIKCSVVDFKGHGSIYRSWLSQAVGKQTKEEKFKACQKETLYQGNEIQVFCKKNVNKAVDV